MYRVMNIVIDVFYSIIYRSRMFIKQYEMCVYVYYNPIYGRL